MMNSPGAVLTIGLVLSREAGVHDPEVATAIERSATLLRFYIGKGSVPYGDHAPFMESHEDNGKCGMAAVLFDQLQEEPGARFFASMSTAAYGSERDQGHTGNFFNMTWAMPGVSRGGPHATGAWMKEFGGWYFDLARTWEGMFPHQGPPQPTNDSYGGWDATGAYLIAYAMPRKAIRLTGKKASVVKPFSQELARQLIHDGRGFHGYRNVTEYKALDNEELLAQLSSWSPIVRRRTGIAIGKRNGFPIQKVMALLDSPDINTRLGACEALGRFGQRGAPAIPTLVSTMEKADDLWLRVKAAEALAAIGPPAMEAVPALLRAMAKDPAPDDPRNVEQRYMVSALFHPRLGLLRHSLEGVDKDLFFGAIRAGLVNQDGATRGILRTALDQLTIEQARPILPEIHRAIVEPAPSGIMFDGQIQLSGLQLLSRHKVSEGIELLADYVRTMKKHASQRNVVIILDLLKGYGAHAQRAIPQLEKAIDYFENEETDFPKDLSLQKAESVRQAIREIKAMTDRPELIELNL